MFMIDLLQFLREFRHLGTFCGLLIALAVLPPTLIGSLSASFLESFGGATFLGIVIALDLSEPSDSTLIVVGGVCAIAAIVLVIQMVHVAFDRQLAELDAVFDDTVRLEPPVTRRTPALRRITTVPLDCIDLAAKRRAPGMTKCRWLPFLERVGRRF